MVGSPNCHRASLSLAGAVFPRKWLLAIIAFSIGLVGCGDEDQTFQNTDKQPGELYFSYPAANQAAVPVTAPVFMRFTLNANNSAFKSESGLPLQTEILTQGSRAQNNRRYGGSPLTNRFRATSPLTDRLAAPLRNLPSADANADLVYEKGIEAGVSSGESIPNSAGLQVQTVEAINDETLVQGANIGCKVGLTCEEDQHIYLNGMLDVFVAGDVDNEGSLPVDILPSMLTTTAMSVWAFIDTSFVDAFPDFVLSVEINENEEIRSGPMLMRIRYAKDDDGNAIPPKGLIRSDGNDGLIFETTLNIYLDAPYLDPSIGPANLQHNLRSYEINGLELEGPVTFMDDGRMQIVLENVNSVPLDVDVKGEIDITPQNTGGICGSPLFGWLCEAIANGVVDANTRIKIEIPAKQLKVNYLSPFTQH